MASEQHYVKNTRPHIRIWLRHRRDTCPAQKHLRAQHRSIILPSWTLRKYLVSCRSIRRRLCNGRFPGGRHKCCDTRVHSDDHAEASGSQPWTCLFERRMTASDDQLPAGGRLQRLQCKIEVPIHTCAFRPRPLVPGMGDSGCRYHAAEVYSGVSLDPANARSTQNTRSVLVVDR